MPRHVRKVSIVNYKPCFRLFFCGKILIDFAKKDPETSHEVGAHNNSYQKLDKSYQGFSEVDFAIRKKVLCKDFDWVVHLFEMVQTQKLQCVDYQLLLLE
jgi:hypothetical protein